MDHSLHVKQMGEYLLVAILYVDNLIILKNNVTQLKWLNIGAQEGVPDERLRKIALLPRSKI